MLWDSPIVKQESSNLLNNIKDENQYQTPKNTSCTERYPTDLESMLDSFVTSVESLSSIRPSSLKSRRITSPLKYQRRSMVKSSSPSSLITFDRDPAATQTTEHLTDELRWLLIQYGPHQPSDDDVQFLASTMATNSGKGAVRFRSKWFEDIRFSDWLEYSLSTSRAYCFYCRLFTESTRNRAFSRDGIRNWRKCLGSRGQKKKRPIGTSSRPDDDAASVCQRRGLLETHAASEAHKLSYEKYVAFVDRMHFETHPIVDNNQNTQSDKSIGGNDAAQQIYQAAAL